MKRGTPFLILLTALFAAGAVVLTIVGSGAIKNGREDLWLVCDLGMIACFAGALVCVRSLMQWRDL